MPPLLTSRPPGVQLVLGVAVPSIFGLVVGLLLTVSEPAYLIGSLLGIAGGFFAGLEHRDAGEGAVRGFTGGLLFGMWILLPKAIADAEPKAHLPEPEALLVVITTVFGVALGALGGNVRARKIRKRQPPPPVTPASA